MVSTRRFTSPGNFPARVALSGTCLGEHRGQQVARRVVVPVVQYTTARTHPHTIRQHQAPVDPPTVTTGLGGGKPAIGLPDPRAVPTALVLQLPEKLTESGIGDGAGQPA